MRTRTPDVEVTRTMAPEEVPYLMTARQVAGWTGLQYDTVRKMAKRGALRPLRIGGRPMFRRDWIMDDAAKEGRVDVICAGKVRRTGREK